VISYCIASYRPAYCRQLIPQLIEKTTAPYEILVWINMLDEEFEQFLSDQQEAGAPLRIVGRTPENIGMAAYPMLFAAAKFEMVVQIDDDVVYLSPFIAERAQEVFDRFPQVGMVTADVWQDELTTGARPPMQRFREISREFGLYDGPIDGWFAIYRRTALRACGTLRPSRYHALGCEIKSRLSAMGQSGFLCTRLKVFHVTGPAYASYFGMLDFELAKYSSLGRQDVVSWYLGERSRLPPRDELALRVRQIEKNLAGTV
jgi:Glycosyltransferase like family 2